MMKMVNKKRSGFTLVELVIVIAILGILAALAIPRLGKSRETAKIATHNGNVRIIKSAASMAMADDPDVASLTNSDIEEYLDGEEMPKVPVIAGHTTKDDNYAVSLVDGNIVVTPEPIEK